MNKEDKRNYRRILIERMDIQCKMQFATEVRLLNISFSGACIRLNKRLHMGNTYRLHLERGKINITMNSIIVWEKMVTSQSTEKGDLTPIYEVGIRFEDVLSEKGEGLISFIENNFIQKEHRPRLRGLRVEIVEPEMSVITGYPKNYNVLKISESGMLLETDNPLNVESTFNMELNLPEEKEFVKFTGRVATCRKAASTGGKNFRAGVEFIGMSEKDRAKIKKFIDSVEKLNH